MARSISEAIQLMIDGLEVGQRFSMSHVPDEDYFGSEGLGSTAMKAATKSMAHYHAYKTNNTEYTAATEKAFAIGHAAHCLVLEPDLYKARFVIQPEDIKVRRGKKWDEFKDANSEREILTGKDSVLVHVMAESIMTNCGQFFRGGESEKSYWYRHSSGLVLKARIDHEMGDAIIDLKTAYVDDAGKFTNKVKYDYDVQDYHYRLVSGLSDMIFVGVSKASPYTTFLCKQGEDIRSHAQQKVEKAIEDIVFASEVDHYPNKPTELIETQFSDYELARLSA